LVVNIDGLSNHFSSLVNVFRFVKQNFSFEGAFAPLCHTSLVTRSHTLGSKNFDLPLRWTIADAIIYDLSVAT